MKDQRTGSKFVYERGDTVWTPLGAGTIQTDPDYHGYCKVLLRRKVRERLITCTTFEFTRIIRKFSGSSKALKKSVRR